MRSIVPLNIIPKYSKIFLPISMNGNDSKTHQVIG